MHFMIFDISQPDSDGKQQFTTTWEETHGAFRTEKGLDGYPVGYRRGQVFRTHLAAYCNDLTNKGHTYEVK